MLSQCQGIWFYLFPPRPHAREGAYIEKACVACVLRLTAILRGLAIGFIVGAGRGGKGIFREGSAFWRGKVFGEGDYEKVCGVGIRGKVWVFIQFVYTTQMCGISVPRGTFWPYNQPFERLYVLLVDIMHVIGSWEGGVSVWWGWGDDGALLYIFYPLSKSPAKKSNQLTKIPQPSPQRPKTQSVYHFL